ncbi:hypothetical protein [Streptomyces sp. NTK 937]|uniref:hypothetical protein n=1 Tax=Streptomyces sp. NTK 937 TaxID=1487711 RepID=UPI000AF25F29
MGIALLNTVFFTTLGTKLHGRLADAGLSAAQSDKLTSVVTDSAGAAIGPLADHPQTAPVAEAARAAMTDGVVLGGYIAAAFVALGLPGLPAHPLHPHPVRRRRRRPGPCGGGTRTPLSAAPEPRGC